MYAAEKITWFNNKIELQEYVKRNGIVAETSVYAYTNSDGSIIGELTDKIGEGSEAEKADKVIYAMVSILQFARAIGMDKGLPDDYFYTVGVESKIGCEDGKGGHVVVFKVSGDNMKYKQTFESENNVENAAAIVYSEVNGVLTKTRVVIPAKMAKKIHKVAVNLDYEY